MKVITFALIGSLVCSSFAKNESNITCSDFESIPVVGPLMLFASNLIRIESDVNFLLSTTEHKRPVDIAESDFSGLKKISFDAGKKMYIIIHGYMGNSENSWVLDLKNQLLERDDGAVILVDWRKGSNNVNYINSARNTLAVSNRTYYFLESLRKEVNTWSSEKSSFHRIYMIGHSLGAQLCGQISRRLKRDSFWNIERITGLDPAKPCFSKDDKNLRLGRKDADYVDIIHTQTRGGKGINSFGLNVPLGHVDFYVNGGIIQPECQSQLLKLTCSHSLAHEYFTESIAKENNSTCKFVSYPWDGTFKQAIKIMAKRIWDYFCKDCPKMGINAVKSKRRGVFLVLTATDKPYCDFGEKDVPTITKTLKNHRLINHLKIRCSKFPNYKTNQEFECRSHRSVFDTVQFLELWFSYGG